MMEEDLGHGNPERSGESHEQEAAELVVDRQTLYYGSPRPGLTTLPLAEETTLGAGVYLASRFEVAAGYAELRGRQHGSPVSAVYEVEINDLRLANLCNKQMLDQVMKGFGEVLKERWREVVNSGARWNVVGIYDRAIAEIDKGIGLGYIKLATFSFENLFSQYLQRLGYDGLKALEGGGGGIGRHETYLVFDPSLLTVKSEQDLPTRS